MNRLAMLCCLLPVLVTGCQSNPIRVSDEAVAVRNAELIDLKPWSARGSLLVDSKAQGVINATFSWEARASGFDIRLIGPLGMSTYRITEGEAGARVTGDNQEFTGESAEALLLEAIGVRVPLLHMQDWVVGLQGNATGVERDRQGRIRKMQVTGEGRVRWDVDFQRYSTVDGLDLPRLIVVSGDDVEIKLAIRRWTRPAVALKEQISRPAPKG